MTFQLEDYAQQLVNGCARGSAMEIFAKILTANDDAGRHGVLIPSESYAFFPDLPIPDPSVNTTLLFRGIDAITRATKQLGWKYYERYPERRITRLQTALNDKTAGRGLAIFVRSEGDCESEDYFFDAAVEGRDDRFKALLDMLFGASVPTIPGAFVRLPVNAKRFALDDPLSDLLQRFDGLSNRWIDSRRAGPTGIGHTFESVVGVQENNDQGADFRGIELKCKLTRDARQASGKINLFQLAPVWEAVQSSIDRLRKIGQVGDSGLYSCYSQISTTDNNLGLRLGVQPLSGGIDLYKESLLLGTWTRARLAERLMEKHSRAVFVKAQSRNGPTGIQYNYKELIYCERPDIQRFSGLVNSRRIVFEFTMTERPPGSVRNHGYPWRLVDERELDQLFALQVKLRG